MRRTSRTLIFLQTLGMEAAVVLAAVEIRTLPYSQAILCALGLVIAYTSFRRGRPFGVCCGLVGPTALVLCFALVCGMGCGLDDIAWAPKPTWTVWGRMPPGWLDEIYLVSSSIVGMGSSLAGSKGVAVGLLAVMALTQLVTASLADREISEQSHQERLRVPFQFSIFSLLMLAVVVAVCCGLWKSYGRPGAARRARCCSTRRSSAMRFGSFT